MKTFLAKYWHWLTVTLLFVVLVLFFGKMALPLGDYLRTQGDVRRLEAECAAYNEQISRDSTFLENIKRDDFLESFAREKFYMHAEGEVVYLIEE